MYYWKATHIVKETKKNGFDYGNHFTLSFSLQSISGKREREREREREERAQIGEREEEETSQTRKGRTRERKNDLAKHRSRRRLRSTAPIAISRSVNRRERCFARSRLTLCEIAPSIAISRSTVPIAIDANDASWDRAVFFWVLSVELSRASIAISPLIELASRASIIDDFFSGFCSCFSGFVSSFFFSKHQQIFFETFFEMQPNTWKHFPFWKCFYTNQTQPKSHPMESMLTKRKK